jgi:hypothetical protein
MSRMKSSADPRERMRKSSLSSTHTSAGVL